jgi:branched-subunit amino acid aminotransferase/4-amino-4-deoxychorismate lyase
MHKFVSFNHRVFSAGEINLNALSSAALYGRGIFTTLAIYNAEPFLWEKHWRRLNENAAKIGIDLSDYSKETVETSLTEIINQNQIKNARARITFFDESPSKIWTFDAKNKTLLLIQTANVKEIKENLSLTVSPFSVNSTSPLAGVKSCNYLENILALEDAKKNNFDEAVRINERGEIVSACLANIFWQRGEKLFTPSLKTGCLAGTTRGFFMEQHEVFEVEESLKTLQNADAIFLTSAGIGIVQISRFENKTLTRKNLLK